MNEEIWKDVPGYKGFYEISNFGILRSIKNGRSRIVKNQINSSGYYKIVLHKNKKLEYLKIHQIVCMAFLGHERCGFNLVVNHIDGVRTNNNLSNLELISQKDNMKDMKKRRLTKLGICSNIKNACHYRKDIKKYESYIFYNSNKIHLGYYENLEDASKSVDLGVVILNKLINYV